MIRSQKAEHDTILSSEFVYAYVCKGLDIICHFKFSSWNSENAKSLLVWAKSINQSLWISHCQSPRIRGVTLCSRVSSAPQIVFDSLLCSLWRISEHRLGYVMCFAAIFGGHSHLLKNKTLPQWHFLCLSICLPYPLFSVCAWVFVCVVALTHVIGQSSVIPPIFPVTKPKETIEFLSCVFSPPNNSGLCWIWRLLNKEI